MTIHEWRHLTTTDFEQLDPSQMLVLLPLGAVEQHGPHLPVGTDDLLASRVLVEVIEQIDDLELLLLPSIWCTKSNEHLNFAGTLSLSTETLRSMLHDLGSSLSRSGFRKLVLMNWHGGNTDLLVTATRDIRERFSLFVFLIDGLRLAAELKDSAADEGADFDVHAGRGETSMMLAAFPELVRREWLGHVGDKENPGRLHATLGRSDFITIEGGSVYLGWEAEDLSLDGVIGDPQGANAAEGDRYIKQIAARMATILSEIASFEIGKD